MKWYSKLGRFTLLLSLLGSVGLLSPGNAAPPDSMPSLKHVTPAVVEIKIRLLRVLPPGKDGKQQKQLLQSPIITTTNNTTGRVSFQNTSRPDGDKTEFEATPHVNEDGSISMMLTFRRREHDPRHPNVVAENSMGCSQRLKNADFVTFVTLGDQFYRSQTDVTVTNVPRSTVEKEKPTVSLFVEAAARVVPNPPSSATP